MPRSFRERLRVANAIRFVDRHHTEQPDLTQLAGNGGISPVHFHRLFSAWAGVTPKDFLQCLTLEHVKALLRKGESVLDAALNAGLSGPGRLQDLCVSLDAAPPGEMKSGAPASKSNMVSPRDRSVKRSSAKLRAASLIYRLSMVKVATVRGTFSPVSGGTRNCTAPISARKNYRR
jgi:AraC-like DNA-binding protein